MDENAKHLWGLWRAAALPGAVMIAALAVSVAIGRYEMAAAMVGGGLVVWFVVWNTRRKLLRLFREPTPDRVIEYYRKGAKHLPNGAASVAYMAATAAALYGEFGRAREELAAVHWESLPPLYQGFRQHVLSLMTALEEKEYSIALRHAESAAALCAVSDRFPGAAQSRAALESTVAACRLLSGQGDDATIATLEQASRTLPGVAPAFPAWALARHYHAKGVPEEAARHLGVVRSLVPHCAPLSTLA
jgi:hypothetical protein